MQKSDGRVRLKWIIVFTLIFGLSELTALTKQNHDKYAETTISTKYMTTEDVFQKIAEKLAPNCTMDGTDEPDTCGDKLDTNGDKLTIKTKPFVGVFDEKIRVTNKNKKAKVKVFCKYTGPAVSPHLTKKQCETEITTEIKNTLKNR